MRENVALASAEVKIPIIMNKSVIKLKCERYTNNSKLTQNELIFSNANE